MSESSTGEWLTIDALAKAAGLDRSTVGRRVAKFDRQGLVTVRRVAGRKVVEKGAYDRACEISIDAVQSINASGRKRSDPKMPSGDASALAAEQARRAGLQADLLEMRVAELRRNLLPAHEVVEFVTKAGATLARRIDQLPRLADDLADGFPPELIGALRVRLKAHARNIREQLVFDLRAAHDDRCKSDADDVDGERQKETTK